MAGDSKKGKTDLHGLPDYMDPNFNPYRKASDEKEGPKYGFDFKGFMKRPDDMRLPASTLESLANWKPKQVEQREKFSIPHARQFTEYLLSVTKGVLHKRFVADNRDYKKWDIFLDGEYLGTYSLYSANKSGHPRTYEGRIPHYPSGRDRSKWQHVLLEYAPDDAIKGDCRIDVFPEIPFP